MRIENLEIGFCIVNLIFSLNRIKKSFKLDKRTVFFLDEDNFGHLSEVGKNVVKTVVVVMLRKRSGKENLWWRILLHKLFGIRVDNSFRFPSCKFRSFFPYFKLLTFQSYLPKLLIHVHKIIQWAVFLWLDGGFGLWFIFGRSWAKSRFIVHERGINDGFLLVEGNDVVLKSTPPLPVGSLLPLLALLLLLKDLVIDSP